VQGYTPVIPALGTLRQENLKFIANLGYTVRPCLRGEKGNIKVTERPSTCSEH
jgi:hypothetical protein